MRPISVRFQCFGPYMKEQFIDFTQLEKNGLFLICGETGSGKTTILDAMCYALYGKSSGGLRGDMSVMRCKQAQDKDVTFVEYIFESGKNRYRFFRSMKPRKKRKAAEDAKTTDYNVTCECQILTDGEFVPVPDAKDKVTFLNEKAREIIGLTYDQFRQVIILPQGQFEKLLVSDSEEKEKILVTLFHAERWQKMAIKLYEQADKDSKALDQQKLLIQEKLNSYGTGAVEELEEKAAVSAAELTELQNTLNLLQKQTQRCRQEQEQILLDNQEFEQRDMLKKRLDSLMPKVEAARQEGVILDRADLADTLTPGFQQYELAQKKKLQEERELENARRELEAAQAAVQAVLQQKQTHDNSRAAYTRGTQQVVLLENAKSVYRTLEEKEKAARQADFALKEAGKRSNDAKNEFDLAQTGWECAIKRQQKCMEEHQKAQQMYLSEIGSTLAESLREGMPCPVCGSLSHPDPAQPIEGHVTEAELDLLSKAMKTANRQETTARRQRMEAEHRYSDAQAEQAACQQNAAVAKADYEQALGQRIQGIETEEKLLADIEKLKAAISNFEKADQQIQQRVNAAQSAAQAAQTGLEKAEKNRDAAAEVFEQQKNIWESMRSHAGFDNDSQYRAACMDAAKKQARRTALIQFRTDLTNAQRDYHEKQEQLKDRQVPDVAGAKARLNAAELQLNAVNRQYLLKENAQKTMAQDAADLKKRATEFSAKRAKCDEALVFAKRLRGDYGISLQRYVLGVMLTSITTAANHLLKTVYGGRYQLYRTNEAAGSARKRGLELEIADETGRRSVTTLSGGEKFLLALSLAIGLSTVVQAQGSGIRLEAMFIDEGFGSLDRKSIDDALEILNGIRSSSGLVGIISHVERLAETIPAKIQITKGKEGSTCRISC